MNWQDAMTTTRWYNLYGPFPVVHKNLITIILGYIIEHMLFFFFFYFGYKSFISKNDIMN